MKNLTGSRYVSIPDERLRELELTIASGFAEISGKQEMITKDIEEVKTVQKEILSQLHGEGGLMSRVAKIEQKQSTIWGVLATVGGIISATAAFVLRNIFNGGQ